MNPLSVRTKMLIAVIASILALSGVIYLISTLVLLPSYTAIERAQVERDLGRATDAIENFSNEQLFKLRDWAQWDDSYAFARDRDPEFLTAALAPTALANLALNIGMFTDTSGALIHVLSIDLETGDEIDGTEVANELIRDGSLTTHATLESAKTGIFMTTDGVLVVSSRPLSRTDGTGPSTGNLIFARYLDEAKVTEFADLTHLTLSVYRYDDASLPEDVAEAKGRITPTRSFVKPVSNEFIAGYAVMEDVHGEPALIVKIEEPRPVYAQGNATFSLYLIVGGLALLIFGGVVLLLLDRLVIARFVKLTEDVDSINDDKDLTKRVTGGAMDEIGRLAGQINRLLGWLSQAREGEAKARREMVNLVNDLKKETEQAKEFKDILGKSE